MEIAQVSFAKGEVSPIAAARTDAAFYATALGLCSDFFVRAEGGVSNRPGLQYVGQCLSNTPNGSYILPFIYNNEQSYICEFSAGSMQFYSEGAFVQNFSTAATITHVAASGHVMSVTAANTFSVGQQVTITGVAFTGTFNPNGVWTLVTAGPTGFTTSFLKQVQTFTYVSGGQATVPYNLVNNYALADLPSLRWAQSADTLSVVVGTQPMYQLKRVTVNEFTFQAPQLLFGPFQDLNTDGTTTVFASATQGTVTLTASAPIFLPQHVGALFTLQEQFLNSIAPWEAQKILVNLGSPVGMYIRSDNKIYQCVAAAVSTDHTATGTFQPVHTSGTIPDGDGQPVPSFANVSGVSWQFVSTDAGCALITQYISATQVKATVQSYKGVYSNFPPTTVGGPVPVIGTAVTFSGNGTTKLFTGLTAATTSDPNQFYVTVNGVFQDPSTYTIDLTMTMITFYTPPPTGTNNVKVEQVTGSSLNIYPSSGDPTLAPFTGLCLSTYWAFGSVSQIQGYPSDICYYNDRLVLAGTTLQPQTFFTSQVSDYLNFGVTDPQVDSDAITETLNSRQQNPINNLLPMNNLLLGTASASWRITDTSGLGAITPSDISVVPQEFFGMQDVPAVQTGTTIIYVQWGGRKLRDIIYQFYNDKFLGTELTVFARQMFPAGTTIERVAFSPEPYGLVFCVRSDGVMCVCTYLPEQQVTAWAQWHTQGFFEDVCVLPENGAFTVYVIVRRFINGAMVRYIEKFAPREYATIQDGFFVDSGLTYDGRNTTPSEAVVTGGTTWMAQDTGTITISSNGFPGFQASDVGNAIWYTDDEGATLCRFKITTVLNGNQSSVTFLDPVPQALQSTGTASWTFAKLVFSGLTNLIGQTVAIAADAGYVGTQVVNSMGGITLAAPGGVVHAGLPYTPQLQSLNYNQQNQPSIRNKAKTSTGVAVVVDQSAPFFAGPDFEHLFEAKQREFEDYGVPTAQHTGLMTVPLSTTIDDDSTLCLQHNYPLALTILGWVLTVDLGEPAP